MIFFTLNYVIKVRYKGVGVLKNDSRLLTIKEVAELLRISPRTIYNQVRKNADRMFPIPVKRIGKLIRFRSKDVQRFIDKL